MLKFTGLQIKRKEHTLIDNFNVEVNSGQFIVLTGANGTGKSTLLKTMVGLLPIGDGEIEFNKRRINDYTHEERSRLIAYINSKKIEEEYIRVIDLVRLGRYPYLKVAGQPADVDANIASIIKALGIDRIQNKFLNEISDGELQKAAIARALVQDTPFLVMDEPTAFLDYPSKKELFQLLKSLSIEKNKLIICATHDVELAALYGSQYWHLDNKVIGVSDKSIAWTKI